MDERRLDRIETKLDQLTRVVTDLARIEERMVTLFKRMDKYDAQQTTMDGRLSSVEKVTVRRGVVYDIASKAFWVVIGAALTYIAKTQGG